MTRKRHVALILALIVSTSLTILGAPAPISLNQPVDATTPSPTSTPPEETPDDTPTKPPDTSEPEGTPTEPSDGQDDGSEDGQEGDDQDGEGSDDEGGKDGSGSGSVTVTNFQCIENCGGVDMSKIKTTASFDTTDVKNINIGLTTTSDTRDLATVGASANTRFRISLRASGASFDPQTAIVIGSKGRLVSSSAGDPATATIEFGLTQAAANWQVEASSPEEWPTRTVTATKDMDAFGLVFLVESKGTEYDDMQGVFLATDAQEFNPPTYQPPQNGQPPTIKLHIAAPHYRADGETLNTGNFYAFLPDRLLSEWGVSDPNQLTATAPAGGGTLTITPAPGGIEVRLTGYHYSAGNVTITTNQTASDNTTAPGNRSQGGNRTQLPEKGPVNGTPAGVEGFLETSPLSADQTDPNSLAGKIRVESQYKDNTTVTLRKNTTTNYTLAITIPNGTNVTFYLQQQAVAASQNISNVTASVGGQQVAFGTTKASNSNWITFQIDHFSTRTVSFTSGGSGGTNESTGGNDSTQTTPSVTVTQAPNSVQENSSFTIEYNLTANDSSLTLEVTNLPNGITVSDFAGDVQSEDPTGTPPSASTSFISADSTGAVTITYQAGKNVTGANQTSVDLSIEVTASNPLSGATTTTTTSLTVEAPSATPDDPRKRALQIAGKNKASKLTQSDITAAITRFNRGQSVNGIDIGQNDITTLITLFERNN